MSEETSLPEGLSEAQQAVREFILNADQKTLDLIEAGLFLTENPEFWEKPVSFRTFVIDDKYLGLQDDVYRKVLSVGEGATEGNFRVIVVLAGIGGGKSTLAQLLACYYTYWLLCMKNPHKFFKLAQDKPIVVLNMGVNASQAKNVIFAGIRSFVMNSVWFAQFNPEILVTTIKFGGKVHMMSGNSKETAPLGMNIFVGILDEAAFYMDTDQKSTGEDIFNAMGSRVTSRFGQYGKVIAISSPNYEDDFISKLYADSREHGDYVYGYKAPSWILKNREVMADDVFVFDHKDLVFKPEIIPNPSEIKLLRFEDPRRNDHLWIIPTDYQFHFKRNPEKATRDFGAIALMNEDTFIKIPALVDQAFGRIENFVNEDGTWEIKEGLTSEPLYVHIDLGLNKISGNSEGDACGIAVGYFDGYDGNSEGRVKVKIVALERIMRSEIEGEINFRDVRARVFALANNGYQVGKVTIDGWQSIDTIQTFNSQGIPCELLSIDKDLQPYESLKEGLYEKRVWIPESDIAKKELKQLEVIKGKKIDHPKKGSKDCSDAIAGVMFSIVRDYGVDMAGEGGGGVIKFR